MNTESIEGSRYSMPIVDDYSRFVTVYFLSSKHQAADLLLECIASYGNITNNRVQTVQTDNGGEFTSSYLRNKLLKRGITLQTTVPYTPQQNGIAERMNRTLVDRARTVLSHAGLPPQYWQNAMATVAHVTNRLITNANDRYSPFELWTGKRPDLSHLRVFGCRAYAHVPDQKRTKFDPKATSCIFLGYASNQKGYLLQEETTQKLLTSRDVSFDEHLLPRKAVVAQDVVEDKGEDSRMQIMPSPTPSIDASTALKTQPSDPSARDTLQAAPTDVSFGTTNPARQLRSSTRVSSRPARIAHEMEDDHVRRNFAHLVTVPINYQDAIKREDGPHWQQSMAQEYDSLIKNKTWNLCELPAGRKAIKSKWVYKIKTKADGSIDRYKSRLVAQGFSQRVGVDYDETFSPVATMATIRSLICLLALG
jgi:hypothetical protein